MAAALLSENDRKNIDMLSGHRPRVRRSMMPEDVYELMRVRANANEFFQNMKLRSQKIKFQTMVKDALELDRLNRGALKMGARSEYHCSRAQADDAVSGLLDKSKARRRQSTKATKKHVLKKVAMTAVTKEARESINIQVDLQKMKHLVKDVQESKWKQSQVKPLVRFRRAARAVFVIIKVCNVCRELLAYSVMQEKWYSLVDSLLSIDPGQVSQSKGRPRPFVTFFPDEKLKKIVQLTFDANEFRRGHSSGGMVSEEVKTIMSKPPGTRCHEEINEVIKCLKLVSESFKSYSLDTQKRICQLAFYDRYTPNRVILRKGLPADGLYIVLTGQLAEHDPEKKKPREINMGERFGEYDLICGCTRRTTVVTTTMVDLIYIHRFDYQEIFNMSVDSNNPAQLDICRNNLIFRHFPMQRLVDNPGTWSVLKYKFGQLMVRNSNDIEWIYIIKSGEARVLKHMNNIMIDIKGRRKRLQDEFEAESPYHKQKLMLKFVSDQKTQISRYRRDAYALTPSPRAGANTPTFVSRSVTLPSVFSTLSTPTIPTFAAEPVSSARFSDTKSADSSKKTPNKNVPDITIEEEEDIAEEGFETTTLTATHPLTDEKLTTPIHPLTADKEQTSETTIQPQTDGEETDRSPIGPETRRRLSRRPSILKNDGTIGRRDSNAKQLRLNLDLNVDEEHWSKQRWKSTPDSGRGEKVAVPPFLQIETLHAGSVFGLRACLEDEEQGPSASLVSSGCEVLQINRKFFIRHADEAVLTLIKANCKQFPTQDELLDRLDTNFQWQEHKDSVLTQFCEDIEIKKGRAKTAMWPPRSPPT